MNEKTFRNSIYVVLVILILLFYTKDIDLSGNSFYKKIKQIENPDSIMVLVNKTYQLQKDYVPNDLETISLSFAHENKMLKKEAKEAFENLSKDASILGYKIVATSAYRDYDYQKKLFEEYSKEKGEIYALECSAKPGHSEHQTGLALDVAGSNDDYDDFENSIEFPWMKENAHKYGFILRYPKGKEKITGFKYEPWHYRYVGIEVAKIIYEENITLEEYYDQYL